MMEYNISPADRSEDDWMIDVSDTEKPIRLDGEYVYTVKDYRREEFAGDRFGHPAGRRAVFTLEVATEEGPVTVSSPVYVVKAMDKKLKSLCISVGLLRHGESLKTPLSALINKRGIGLFKNADRADGEVTNYLSIFLPYDAAKLEKLLPAAQVTFTEVAPPDDCPW